MKTPIETLAADPWTAAFVDDEVAKYELMLAPDELAWMREQLFEMLIQDPHASKLLRRAHPRVADSSAKVDFDEAMPTLRQPKSEAR